LADVQVALESAVAEVTKLKAMSSNASCARGTVAALTTVMGSAAVDPTASTPSALQPKQTIALDMESQPSQPMAFASESLRDAGYAFTDKPLHGEK